MRSLIPKLNNLIRDEEVACIDNDAVSSSESGQASIQFSDSVSTDPEKTDALSVESNEEQNSLQENNDLINDRLPYYKRHYLLYGGEDVPKSIDLEGTLEFLNLRGYGKSAIKQARDGKRLSDAIAESFVPNKPGVHYCDFCGIELVGTEYDILQDGRERCPACSRTALKRFEDFKLVYNDVVQNLQAYFGISVGIPVDIEVVNSKKLHAKINKSFVPSLKPTPRVLGYARRDKKGNFSLCFENGSPRVSAIMTMVHELTHIWQYVNWDAKSIKQLYGSRQELEVYEGMAKWVEIQYAYLIGESAAAIRMTRATLLTDDEYGRGLAKYLEQYPLTEGTRLIGQTPFADKFKPL